MNKLFDLSGRTALVTGSSRGLGRAMAEGLAAAGAAIILNGAVIGSESLVAESNAGEGGGGLMGMLGGMMGGGVMALGQKLMSAGVPMGQMQPLGQELFAYGREKAGEDVMGPIVGSIPGLNQFV